MKTRDIYLTDLDAKRLNELLMGAQKISPLDEKHMKELKEEVNRGKVVPAHEIPKNVVTMNSRVRFKDLDSGEETTYWLVFPQDAKIEHGKISILAPIGTALLGYREGDVVEWPVPEGRRRIEIIEVLYQPEAAGRFDL